MQADILHLHQIGKKFDIIESAGVLHHMNEPMAGWRVLTDLLKSGGLMKVGLYSELPQIVKEGNSFKRLNVYSWAIILQSHQLCLKAMVNKG